MNGSMIGKVFNNRYQITERIGIGGMAEVYRAQDRVLGRMVAIKVMLPQYASDAEFTKRFRQEAASAANLSSPYIVNVYDWGQDDGTYYIVMEYVRGSDLKTAIKQRGAINQRKVAEIGAQVCQALSVAHNQDIVHRDIKPQNIMVQPDGNVKVMDFGIARAKNSMQGETSAVLGTAHYVSPEQAQGKELTSASDIYSLGIVLYEAATGKLPFDGPDSVTVATKQVQEFPVAPTQVNPNVDPGLEAIIMKALEKDPRDRFATVGDMKHALNDFLAGRSVTLGDAVVATEAATEVVSHTSGPIYENTTVMPPLEQQQYQQAPNYVPQPRTYIPVEEEEERSSTGRTVAIVLAILAALALIGAAAWFLLGNAGGSHSSASTSASASASSSEATQASIPNVAGSTVEAATTALEQAGFKVAGIKEINDDNYASGQVVRTDPAIGSNVEKGTAITLFVSVGKEKVLVPDLSTSDANGAKQLIEAAGLKAQEGSAEFSDSVAEGIVIKQDPAAGTSVDKGATVTYILSKGSDKVAVEDVLGRSEADATATLRNQGFTVEVYHSHSAEVAQGMVMTVNPEPGTKLNKGDTVSITISDGAIMHYVSAEIYADPQTNLANVALDTYQVADGGSVGYYITVPEGYSIVSVTDGATNYGTGSVGQITNVKHDLTLVVSLIGTAPTPEPTVDPSTTVDPTQGGTIDPTTGLPIQQTTTQ